MNRGPDLARETTQRLFFALWPTDAVCRSIRRLCRDAVRQAGGRPVPADNYHITLAFLGSVPDSALEAVREAARRIQPPALSLELNRIAHWPRSRIAWLGPEECPTELNRLVDELWAQLKSLGFEPDLRTYRPHVSLCRKAGRSVHRHLPRPVQWETRDFVLVESRTDPAGSVYTILERFSG